MILWLSKILLPFVISYVIAFGLISHRPIFDDFLDGCKERHENRGRHFADPDRPDHGGRSSQGLRTSGCGDQCLRRGSRAFAYSAELVPITLMRLVSNSAATGLLLDLFRQYGQDSRTGMAASVLMSSTETVFYCLSIYFGSVKVRRTRYTVPGALIATAAGIAASIWITG